MQTIDADDNDDDGNGDNNQKDAVAVNDVQQQQQQQAAAAAAAVAGVGLLPFVGMDSVDAGSVMCILRYLVRVWLRHQKS